MYSALRVSDPKGNRDVVDLMKVPNQCTRATAPLQTVLFHTHARCKERKQKKVDAFLKEYPIAGSNRGPLLLLHANRVIRTTH